MAILNVFVFISEDRESLLLVSWIMLVNVHYHHQAGGRSVSVTPLCIAHVGHQVVHKTWWDDYGNLLMLERFLARSWWASVERFKRIWYWCGVSIVSRPFQHVTGQQPQFTKWQNQLKAECTLLFDVLHGMTLLHIAAGKIVIRRKFTFDAGSCATAFIFKSGVHTCIVAGFRVEGFAKLMHCCCEIVGNL